MPTLARSSWPRWAKAATSPWALSPLIVVALLAGTFAAYGAYTRHRPTHSARGGDSFATLAPSSTPSSTPASGTPSAGAARPARSVRPPRNARTKAAQATATSHARPHTARDPVRGGSTQTSGGTTTSGGPRSPAPVSPTTVVTPHTGSYTLSVSGTEHVKFGPFSACSNTFPSSADLTVHTASGEPAGSFDFDLRLYPDSPDKHDERHIYRYTPSSVLLTYEQATVTCGGVKQSSTVDYSPAQQRVQLPLRVGDSWHVDGGDSGREETGSFRVTGTTPLTYGGHSYQTYVIDAHLTMSGSESGTRDQRWWYAPALGLPLKWHESMSGQRSGATYSEDLTVSIVAGP